MGYNSSSAVPAQEFGPLLGEPIEYPWSHWKTNFQLHQFSVGLQIWFCCMYHSSFQLQEQVFREREVQTAFCGSTDLVTNQIATWRYIRGPAWHKPKKDFWTTYCCSKSLLPRPVFISPTQKKIQWHPNHFCDSSAELFTHTAIRQAG